MNGLWCLLLLGRWTMVTGWLELIRGKVHSDTEFVSADVRMLNIPKAGNYEMLSRDRDNLQPNNDNNNSKFPQDFSTTPISPLSPVALSNANTPNANANSNAYPTKSGRETPDYFGKEARYKSPTRSFSSPKPPHGTMKSWDSQTSHAMPPREQQQQQQQFYTGMDPLSMNKI